MRNWKLFGKIGAIALTALGLALVPGDFNVPGVGTVEAFAANEITEGDLSDFTVTKITTDMTDNTSVYTGDEISVAISKIEATNANNEAVELDATELDVKWSSTIKNVGKYSLVLTPKSDSNFENRLEVADVITVTEADLNDVTVDLKSQLTYTGDTLTPKLNVKLGTVPLVEGTDYNATYTGNVKNAGTYKVTLTPASKNFEGAKVDSTHVVVGQANANKVTVDVDPKTAVYTGEAQNPTMTATLDGTDISSDVKFVWYADANDNGELDAGESKVDEVINVGKYIVEATGENIDSSTNHACEAFEVTGANISEAEVTGLKEKVWLNANTAGTKYEQTRAADLIVTLNGKTLTYNKDYTVGAFAYNKAGTAEVVITGKGNYAGTGTAKGYYTVVERNLTSYGKMTLNETSFAYNGEAQHPGVTVTLSGAGLDDLVLTGGGTDYAVSYSSSTGDEKNVGTVTVIARGVTGKATGQVTATYDITPADLSAKGKSTVTIVDQDYNYGLEIKPITDGNDTIVKYNGAGIKAGDDYTVEYSNNVDAGTATATITGKGNYTGTVEKTFTIKPVAWNAANLVVSGIDEKYPYTGSAIQPKGLKIVDQAGHQTLVEDKDYSLSYGGNKDIGEGSIKISGIGNYKGSAAVTKTFTIVAADLSSEKVATITAKAQTYTGKELTPVVVTQTLSDGTKKTLTAGTDYDIVYENNTNAGTAKYTITGKETAGYTGTKSGEFTINKAVTKAKITKLESKNGKNTVAPKKKLQLVATQTPTKADANHTLKNKITWSSNNKKVATVKNGKVTGVKAGTATITAKSADGTKKTFKVTVVGVTSKTAQTVKVGKSVKIKANDTIKKATATSGKAYVKVSKSGKTVTIKGVKAGKAKVTITTANGGKDVVTVTVK